MTEPNGEVKPDAGKVTCPACGSVHSADGGALFERSANLRDLEAAKPKLKKLAAAVLVLEKKLEEAAARPAPVVPVAVPAPAREGGESGERKKHGKYL